MSSIVFEAFPKIPRLNRSITITEKIDGTNAAVVIVDRSGVTEVPAVSDDCCTDAPESPAQVAKVGDFLVFAQSRNRFITPGADNYGFARWVQANAEALVSILGPGRHFGEWWGSGIQRGYGLTNGNKRFSLFNTDRWDADDIRAEAFHAKINGLGVVPVLYEGPFDQVEIDERINRLRQLGSEAAPGFNRPEGVVVYHQALRSSFKVTVEGDAAPKGAAGHALDEEKVAA